MNRFIEILSPAGEMESLMAAVNNGADAVYVGGSSFSARKNAVNFTDEQLKAAVEYAHLRGVKVYVALNTLIHENELKQAYEFICYCADIGVDALIVQDLGAVYMLRRYFPHMRMHASTQMTVHNRHGAQFVHSLGFERVVLSRELSLDEIKDIAQNCEIETEVFAHGALCMCYSGQCLMSSLIGGRSGNRGACAQPCRLPYTVCDSNKKPIGTANKYYMSLKDLCTVDNIGRFIDIGVDSLKIEGRMKSSEYVSVVTGMYNKYRGGDKVDLQDMQLLENVFSRSGFTTGYLHGKTGRDMLCIDTHNDNVYSNIGDDVHRYADSLLKVKKLMPLDVFVSVVLGELPYITLTYGEHTVTAFGENAVQAAQKSETSAQRILEQVGKFGGTAFEAADISCSIDSGINIPIKEINNLRRSAVAMLEQKILAKHVPEYGAYDYVKTPPQSKPVGRSASVRTVSQAEKAYDLGFDRIYIPYSVYTGNKQFFDDNSDVFALMLPTVASDSLLEKYAQCGLDRVCISNISQIPVFAHKAMCINYTMNVYNSMTQQMLMELGADSICLSPELNIGQLADACCNADSEIMVYGRIALMTLKNCLVKSSSGRCGCSSEVRYLKDRRDTYFPFYTDTSNCTNIVYNSVPLYMGDRLNELKKLNAGWMRFDFTDETQMQMEQIVCAFDSGKKMPEGTFTRGHYYRGVE